MALSLEALQAIGKAILLGQPNPVDTDEGREAETKLRAEIDAAAEAGYGVDLEFEHPQPNGGTTTPEEEPLT